MRIRDVLTDERLWAERDKSWAAWARETGFHYVSIKQAMANTAWRRSAPTGELTHAPCARCSAGRPVRELSRERVCRGCERQTEFAWRRAIKHTNGAR